MTVHGIVPVMPRPSALRRVGTPFAASDAKAMIGWPQGNAFLTTAHTVTANRVYYTPFVVDHAPCRIGAITFGISTGVASSIGYAAIWTADDDWQPERRLFVMSGSTATSDTAIRTPWGQALPPGRYLVAFSDSHGPTMRALNVGTPIQRLGGAPLAGNNIACLYADTSSASAAWQGVPWVGTVNLTNILWITMVMFEFEKAVS